MYLKSILLVTAFEKMCLVHTSNFSTLKIHKIIMLGMMDIDLKLAGFIEVATIPLSFPQMSDLYTVPTRFSE